MLVYSSCCSPNEQHHMYQLGCQHSSGVWERFQTSDRECFRLSLSQYTVDSDKYAVNPAKILPSA